MISVFTPSHDPRYLDECWASLRAQTFTDWEWIVVLNGGARWDAVDAPWEPGLGSRVKVFCADEIRGVGALKHFACSKAQGEILLELDHDDLLASHALEDVAGTFEMFPEVGFVYSDTAQILEDGSADLETFDVNNGWEYRHDVVDLREVFPVRSLEPTPHNLSLIWFAPNHLRAFRKSVYESVGGYDIGLDVLDDQDLMCRMYQATEFKHLPECLYLQRVGVGNTQALPDTNAVIQSKTVELYDRYIEGNCLAWAKRQGLGAYDLGGAHNSPDGYTSVDLHDADICGDIFDVLGKCPDDSLGVIRASDFLERVVPRPGSERDAAVLHPFDRWTRCLPGPHPCVLLERELDVVLHRRGVRPLRPRDHREVPGVPAGHLLPFRVA